MLRKNVFGHVACSCAANQQECLTHDLESTSARLVLGNHYTSCMSHESVFEKNLLAKSNHTERVVAHFSCFRQRSETNGGCFPVLRIYKRGHTEVSTVSSSKFMNSLLIE